MNKSTQTKIAELAARNKITHAKRFAVEIGGFAYGLQARVTPEGSVVLIAVPVDQASGFDKITRALRKVQATPSVVLDTLESKYPALKTEYSVVGQVESKNHELVDQYGLTNATVEGFEPEQIVTVAKLATMDKSAINTVLETFTYVMPDSVKANIDKMKSDEGRKIASEASKKGHIAAGHNVKAEVEADVEAEVEAKPKKVAAKKTATKAKKA